MNRITYTSLTCILALFSQSIFSQQNYKYGVHPSGANDYEYAMDMGINFNREGIYVIWNWVDSNMDSMLSFKNAILPENPDVPGSGGVFNYDNEREKLVNITDIQLMNNICPNRNEDFDLADTLYYRYFVEKTVERYDGDDDLGCNQNNGVDCYGPGDNEYPEAELIAHLESNPIKYWQVCNQVTDVCGIPECSQNELYAEKYAIVQRITYEAVKNACPECKVLIGGDSSKDLYPPVYQRLDGNYIDVIDFHRFGEAGMYNPASDFEYLKQALVNAGFDLADLEFWITETGTHSGDPVPALEPMVGSPRDLAYQTELQQAIGLMKIYISAYAYGIEAVLWAWGINEGFKRDGAIFDYTGLIYDGYEWTGTSSESGVYTNIPGVVQYDRGADKKKLSYFTLKKMAEIMDGAELIETLEASDGNHVYKINKADESLYFAWSEQGMDYNFTDLESNYIKITESVPNEEFGEYVTDYASAFNSSYQSVNNGSSSVQVDSLPLIIELTETNSLNEQSHNEHIQIYPNPSNNGLVTLQSDEKIEKVEVFDINGIKLTELNIEFGQTQIDLGNFSNGFYLIKVSTNKSFKFEKFIIRK